MACLRNFLHKWPASFRLVANKRKLVHLPVKKVTTFNGVYKQDDSRISPNSRLSEGSIGGGRGAGAGEALPSKKTFPLDKKGDFYL